VAANACQVGNGSSRAPSVLRTLGRSTRTLRPPRVTLPGWVPWRTALRSGLWRPLGPTSRATSAASMTWSTCRPVPTAKASRPSRAVPASSTTATVTCSGSSSSARSVVAVRWVSFGTAVPFWSGFLADARHLPHGRHQAGTATSTSTETGTTSYPILMRLAERGQVETAWETDPPSGRPARHLCRLSGKGARFAEEVLAAAAAEIPRPIRSGGAIRPALGEAF
jgi:hypothetical protein